MLAIEQLTGTAKPTIVTLGGKSGTGATKDLLELQKQLNAARTQENSAAENVKSEEAKVAPKQTAYDAAKKDHDDKEKANSADSTLPGLKTAYEGKKAELDAATEELTKAKTKHTDAEKNRSTIEATLKAARGNIDTAAESGTSQIGGVQESFYVGSNPTAAMHIASIVRDIQQTHLWQSYATGDCLRFLLQDTKEEMKKWDGVHKINIRDMCVEQIKNSTKWRFENLYLSYGCTVDGKNCKYDPNNTPPSSAGPALLGSQDKIGSTGVSGPAMIPSKTTPTELPSQSNISLSPQKNNFKRGPASVPTPTPLIPSETFSK